MSSMCRVLQGSFHVGLARDILAVKHCWTILRDVLQWNLQVFIKYEKIPIHLHSLFPFFVVPSHIDRGVRVNCINPGIIDTEVFLAGGLPEEAHPEFYEMQAAKHPLKRIGQAEEVVNAMAFLASDKAGFITGINLKVDGGITTKSAFC